MFFSYPRRCRRVCFLSRLCYHGSVGLWWYVALTGVSSIGQGAFCLPVANYVVHSPAEILLIIFLQLTNCPKYTKGLTPSLDRSVNQCMFCMFG